MNLGGLYHDMGNSALGLKYYKIALDLAQKINHERLEKIALGNIGIIYENKGSFNDALQYFKKALSIGQKNGEKIGCGIAYIKIGQIFTYFKRSYALAFKTNLKLELSDSLDELISVYEKIGKDKEKQKYLKLKLKITKGTGIKI